MSTPLLRIRGRLAGAALVMALTVPGIDATAAAGFDPPPISEPPTLERHVGKIVWVELVTPDMAAAERFYTGLFGWTFQDRSSGGARYGLALQDGQRVAGIIEWVIRPSMKVQPSWLTFIAVQDVDVTAHNAVAAGGKLIRPPHTFTSRGRQAILADPQGAVFAILASDSGDPPDLLASPGAWIWGSLLATNASTDAAFYQSLFGYDVFDLESEDGLEHVILSTEAFARASVNTLPADSLRRHPRWLNFVRVADAGAAASQAVALGGSVLVPPRADRHGGMLAVLADPAGAAFGVMEWTVREDEEQP